MKNAELATVEEHESSVQKHEMKIPFAQLGDMLDQTKLEKLAAAPKLDFDTNASTWSPEDKGECKRLVFQGIKEKAQTKNIYKGEDPEAPEYVYLDKAVFVEVYNDGDQVKQRMIESFATSLIAYLRENNVPRHAIMDVEFDGEKKANSGFKYHAFKINLVPVNFG